MSNENEGILKGRFLKVSQEERIITAKKEGETDSKYYVVYLTNGVKTFDLTAGEKNPVLPLPVFKPLDISFDVQDRKLKIASAQLAVAERGGKSKEAVQPEA